MLKAQNPVTNVVARRRTSLAILFEQLGLLEYIGNFEAEEMRSCRFLVFPNSLFFFFFFSVADLKFITEEDLETVKKLIIHHLSLYLSS